MKRQQTFSDIECSVRQRVTKGMFLKIMDEIIPWDEWVEFVRPNNPKGERGRPPRGIELTLRVYLLQVWFNLSDEMVEDTIYGDYAMRKFQPEAGCHPEYARGVRQGLGAADRAGKIGCPVKNLVSLMAKSGSETMWKCFVK